MKTLDNLFVAACCLGVLAACGSDKKDPAKTAETAEADQGEVATPVATAPAGKAGLGGLGSLLGGGKPHAGAARSGLLGGLGLGGVLGGGAAGAPVQAKADGQGLPTATTAATTPAATTPAPGAAGVGCKKVAVHLGKILEQELKSGSMQGNTDIPPDMVAQMVPMIEMTCQQLNWSAQAQACVLAATDSASIEKCESLMPDMGGDMGGDMDMGDMGGDMDIGDEDFQMPDMADMPTTPVPSGDAECDQVAAQLITALLSTMAPEEAATVGSMKVMMQNEIAKECASTPWPKPVRSCLLGAKTQADMEKCAALM